MVSPPKWFLSELACIDPTYYVRAKEESQIYEIVKDADVVIESPFRGAFRITGPKVVDVFRYLNADALTKLRKRKWWGRQLKIIENPRAEFNFLLAQEKAAKAKEMDLAHDMMTEGLLEGYRIDRKKSWSYGGRDVNKMQDNRG
jgi:hypothetical protein